jgi:hypothetical protein
MLNKTRRTKENKSIIIHTRNGNTVSAYRFVTYDCDNLKTIPSGRQRCTTFDKMAEKIEINWNVGGDVFVYLYEAHPNGFEVRETVVFDKKVVTGIEIETDFERERTAKIV